MIRTALLWMFSIFAMVGCSTDYSIIGEVGKEYIYIEVPGEDPTEDIWVDSFVQPASTNGVDILWVIDRSCSMRDEEPLLLSGCLLYTSPSPRDRQKSRMPSSA